MNPRIFCFFLATQLSSSGLSIAEANQILMPSGHIANPIRYFGPSDRELLNKYQLQLLAIRLLGGERDPNNISTLVHYLDYPLSAEYATWPPGPASTDEDRLKRIRSVWPAFAAIIDTPGAGAELYKFTCDTKEPFDLRLTALTVLRYADIALYRKAVSNLGKKYATDEDLYEVIKVFESGQVSFWGLVDIQQMKDVAKGVVRPITVEGSLKSH